MEVATQARLLAQTLVVLVVLVEWGDRVLMDTLVVPLQVSLALKVSITKHCWSINLC
jgi:hypothetical protein